MRINRTAYACTRSNIGRRARTEHQVVRRRDSDAAKMESRLKNHGDRVIVESNEYKSRVSTQVKKAFPSDNLSVLGPMAKR